MLIHQVAHPKSFKPSSSATAAKSTSPGSGIFSALAFRKAARSIATRLSYQRAATAHKAIHDAAFEGG